MAKFGTEDINAAYTPATAEVVQPVPDPTVDQARQVVGAVTKVGSIFMKDAADKQKNDVLGAFSKKMNQFNLALEQGASPTKISSKKRAEISRVLSENPLLNKELTTIATSFNTLTQLGEAQEVEDEEQKLDRELTALAAKDGFIVDGMTVEEEEKGKLLYQQWKEDERIIARTTKKNVEARAQRGEKRAITTHTNQVNEYNEKKNAQYTVKAFSNTQFQKFENFVSATRRQAEEGKITPEQAQTAINAQLVEVQRFASSQAIAGGGFVTSLVKPFENLTQVAMEAISGKHSTTMYRNKVDLLLAQSQMATVTDLTPSQMQIWGTASLFRNSQALGALTETEILKPLIDGINENDSRPVTVLGAQGEEEANIVKGAKALVRELRTGNSEDPETAKKEASTLVNKMLVGAEIYSGATEKASDYAAMADFLASPEYAYAVTEGLVAKEASLKMHDVFRFTYNQEVIKTVQEDLSSPATIFGDKPVAEWVEPKWTGSGVVFEDISKSQTGLISQGIAPGTKRSILKSINKDAQAISALVRMQAHINGHTDYTRAWEENKATFLPMFNFNEEE